MTELDRIRAGVEAAITFSTELLDEAWERYPDPWQWLGQTYNHRQLLYAQLRFYQELGGIGLPPCRPLERVKPKEVDIRRLML